MGKIDTICVFMGSLMSPAHVVVFTSLMGVMSLSLGASLLQTSRQIGAALLLVSSMVKCQYMVHLFL